MGDVATIRRYLIALGGNMPSEAGNAAATLRAALAALADAGAHIVDVSPFYETPCFPAGAGPDYVNAAARIAVGGGPVGVLALLHRVEAQFGRKRVRRWGERTLDLDLLAGEYLAGQDAAEVVPDRATYNAWRNLPPAEQMARAPDRLILPHPRLHERAFVLVPLADIAPDWRHPVLDVDVRGMLAALPAGDVQAVRRLP